MRTLLFLAIVLIAGFSAGILHGLINLITVEPFLDTAMGIENQRMLSSGQVQDTPDFWKNFNAYRLWQKEGQILAGGLLGMAMGSLLGLVFAYTRNSLPTKNHVKKALVLSLIMWLVLFLIPSLKYPANPPGVGDPHTLGFRQQIYAEFLGLSGFGALGFSFLYARLSDVKKILSPIGYAFFMIVVFILMPDNPDKINISMDLVNSFRTFSMITIAIWWIANGVILGILWERFQPHVKKAEIQ